MNFCETVLHKRAEAGRTSVVVYNATTLGPIEDFPIEQFNMIIHLAQHPEEFATLPAITQSYILRLRAFNYYVRRQPFSISCALLAIVLHTAPDGLIERHELKDRIDVKWSLN